MDRYKKIKLIGEGSFGKVFKSKRLDKDEIVAVKKIQMDKENGIPFTAIREIRVLKKNKSKNIVTIHDIIYEDTFMFIVMDFMTFDLTGLLNSGYKFNNQQMRCLVYQLIQAVLYLHQKKLIHRDIKSSNILLNEQGLLKLADFGLTREHSKCMTNRVCTLWYRAPELLLGETCYDNKIDMWSIGCIMIEILYGKPYFKGINEISQSKILFKKLGIPSGNFKWSEMFNISEYARKEEYSEIIRSLYQDFFDEDELSLLTELLRLDAKHRISASNSLRFKCMLNLENVHYEIDHSEIHGYNCKQQKINKKI